jgi:dTDP-4-dehydrorhamnose reductase
MRTLVLGGTGMLGRAVVAEARRRGFPALGLGRTQADIADREGLRHWVHAFRPELVVNCAAYAQVDDCEAQRERAFAINGRAVANVAAVAAEAGARLLQISTDYVFDGRATAPYREDAPVAPLSVYGESKLMGEREAAGRDGALVVRTSLLFGPGAANFVATIVELLERGGPLRVVDDQVAAPTYAPFLARAILDLARLPLEGVVHYRNREPVSRFELARTIARGWAPAAAVEPAKTAEFPRPAARPAYSVLDVGRFEAAAGRPVEPWEWGLADYLRDLRRERESHA